MARIGIDAHAVGGNLTGNETYIVNLIAALNELDSSHEFVLFFTDERIAGEWQDRFPKMICDCLKPTNPLLRIPLVMPLHVWKHGLDLLHVQYAGPPVMDIPMVVMVHDISYEHFPQYFTRKEVCQFRATIPYTIRRARKVLTVSNYSKEDIVNRYGTPKEKITVTYNGVGSEFTPDIPSEAVERVKRAFGIDWDYILTVSNLQPRKNLNRLVSAYTMIRNQVPGIRHKLVIVGKKAWLYDPILAFVKESRWADDIIMTDYVPAADLPALYAGADVFVYPSIFEGFGLPPLEAMASGVPVIVSDRSSLPEVVGRAGVKIDPFDTVGMAAHIAAVLKDRSFAERLGRLGLERAKEFTWEDSARLTLETFEEALREE